MHTLLDDYITGMGFVGIEPGVLYHLAPVTQGVETVLSGTGSVVLENVAGDWVELSLHGRSEQTTTTGVQLFDVTKGGNGWINPENGEFNAGNSANYVSDFIKINPSSEYSISGTAISCMYTYDANKEFIRKENSIYRITTTENAAYFRFAISAEAPVALEKAKITMFNSGSELLPWEPYTGGQASPSPDYPQEIKNCGSYGNLLESIYGAKNGETVTGGKGNINTNDYSDSTFVEIPGYGHERVMQWVSSHTIGYTLYIRLFDENKNILLSSNVNIFSATGQQNIQYVINVPQEAMYYCIIGENNQCTVDDIMLNIGSTALPWEPHGYKIETTIDNAGYLECGSRSDLVKKIPLKKGHRYRLFSTNKNSNKNTFVFADPNLTFAGGNALYSYGINKGLTVYNTTEIVSGESRIKSAWNPAVEFTVTEDGLYLYYGLNGSGLSDDEIWIWTGDGYLTDTPYQEQTITTYTPNGLPGIPVSSGGNYTDETGQQWITDEIDFGRGKYVRMVKKLTSEYFVQIISSTGAVMLICKNCPLPDTNVRNALCNIGSMYSSSWNAGDTTHFFTQNADRLVVIVLPKNYTTAEQGKEVLEQGIEFYYALATPIETDLPAEEIEAYNALRTYKPATIITADGGEVEPGITAKYQKGE